MSLLTISIDDMNTTLIQYNGEWEGINGSTRQWDASIHTTGQAGATATFHFRGYLLWVWGTIPGGVGNNLVQLTIDGGPANITSKTSNGSAVFNVLYFNTPLLTETFHTAVITNLGSTTNGSTEFQLDRFEFLTTDAIPLFAPPGGSTSQTTLFTSSAIPTANIAGPSSSKSPFRAVVSGVVGGVIGALFLVMVFLLFLRWRRMKSSSTDTAEKPRRMSVFFQRPSLQHSSLLPTPFPLNYQADTTPQTHPTELITSTPTGSNSQPVQSNIISVSEKSNYQNLQSSSSTPRWTPLTPSSSSRAPRLTCSTTLNTFGSTLVQPIISTPDDETSPRSLERRDAEIHRLTDLPPTSPVPRSTLSSSADIYDKPPPSYWYNEHKSHAPL